MAKKIGRRVSAARSNEILALSKQVEKLNKQIQELQATLSPSKPLRVVQNMEVQGYIWFGVFVTLFACVAAFAGSVPKDIVLGLMQLTALVAIGGVLLGTSGTLFKRAFADDKQLLDTITRVGVAKVPFDRRSRQQWEAGRTNKIYKTAMVFETAGFMLHVFTVFPLFSLGRALVKSLPRL